ncbi:MAG: DUF2877 domain-containing protein [Planctomycetes bacterium]|nr:DUF2877 domain-containing protein [Planctomycetota bacterium]
MTPSTPPTQPVLRVTRLGDRAKQTLMTSDRFRVIALFTRSMYLANDAGDLVCVLDASLENGPLHLLVDGWPDGGGGLVRDGDRFVRDGTHLLSPTLTLDWTDATVWTPPAYPPVIRETTAAGLDRLLDIAAATVPDETVAATLLFSRPEPKDSLGATLLRKVRDGLHELDDFLTDTEPTGALPAPTSLLGLGPGLTPTGDDILAGIFLASRAVGADSVVTTMTAALRHRIADGTNAISAAHLDAAMDGEANAVFHAVLFHTLNGGDGLKPIVARLHAIGHSSGWDGLLGMLWALRRFIIP